MWLFTCAGKTGKSINFNGVIKVNVFLYTTDKLCFSNYDIAYNGIL